MIKNNNPMPTTDILPEGSITIFGSTAALMRNKLPDRIIVFFSTLFTAVPSFVLAAVTGA